MFEQVKTSRHHDAKLTIDSSGGGFGYGQLLSHHATEDVEF